MRGAAVAIVAAATLTAAAAYGYWTVRSTTVRDHPVATATPTRSPSSAPALLSDPDPHAKPDIPSCANWRQRR